MGRATFPTLLTKKATMFGSLTRFDLGVMGGLYLVFSWMKVSGLIAISINVCALILIKLTQHWFRPGFFKFLSGETQLEWRVNWNNGREDKHE